MSEPQLLFGKYRVVSRVGGGGMGEVFRVRKEGSHGVSRDLALKRILPEVAAEPRFLQLFNREARALAALNHRGIVQMFEFGSEEDGAYLVMEYLDGLDLAVLSRRFGQPLPWPAAVYIGIEVAHALAAAHRLRLEDMPLGLVHGDLSPSNVMVCADGAVKVFDFGLARPAGLELSSSRTFGKITYLPPEAINGLPPSVQLDVYALGVIVYELVTGTRLFRGDNDLQTIHNILYADVAPPSTVVNEVPPALDALLLKALSRDRGRRFSDCEQLAQELEAVLGGRFGPSQLAQFVASVGAPSAHVKSPEALLPVTETLTEPGKSHRSSALLRRAVAPGLVLLVLGGGALTWGGREVTPAPHAAEAPRTVEPQQSAGAPTPVEASVPVEAPSVVEAPPVEAPPPPPAPVKKKQVRRKPPKSAPEALSPGYLANPFEGGGR